MQRANIRGRIDLMLEKRVCMLPAAINLAGQHHRNKGTCRYDYQNLPTLVSWKFIHRPSSVIKLSNITDFNARSPKIKLFFFWLPDDVASCRHDQRVAEQAWQRWRRPRPWFWPGSIFVGTWGQAGPGSANDCCVPRLRQCEADRTALTRRRKPGWRKSRNADTLRC